MKDLMALMKAKKDKAPMSDEYKSVKGGLLKELMKEMSNEMGSHLGGLKKVTVAAPDAHGLKEGLAKAEDMLPGEEGSAEEESTESPEEEKSEMEMCPECEMEHAPGEHMSDDPEMLKAKIKELEAKLAAKGE